MYNKAILVGRLTANPERKSTPDGVTVINFSIATDRPYKGEDGKRKSDFLNVVAWRQQAEFICKYFHKGDPIGIDGSIQSQSYEDKTGVKRTAVEIQADNVFFVGGKAKGVSTVGTDEMAQEEVTVE
ncbi:MAG: single-stranded DNA-binding protein [Angelakisella sp.]